jgi:excinuclease UvrABC helicase subunit UvrB
MPSRVVSRSSAKRPADSPKPVIVYADTIAGSMERAMSEASRRR